MYVLQQAIHMSISSGLTLKCAACRPSITLFIAVPSRREHRPYRDAARSTWMQQAVQTGSVTVNFFVAHDGSDPVQLSWMAAEQKDYGDMVITGVLWISGYHLLYAIQSTVFEGECLQASNASVDVPRVSSAGLEAR